MSSTAKNLTILLGLVTVAVAAYFMFMQGSNSSLSFKVDAQVEQEMRTNSQLFIQRRTQLDAIKLELDILRDERFTALESFNPPIAEQPVGRSNPFSTVVPLPGDGNQ